MTKWLYIVLICFFVASCSKNFKNKVGLVTTGPDEYKVTKNKPLELPPSYLLQEVGPSSKKMTE